MPTTLAESQGLVDQLRAENGAPVAHLSDPELADLAYNQTQDERLLPMAKSNAFQRGANDVSQTFSKAGQWVEGKIADPSSPYLQRLLGRVAGNLVSGAPQLASGVASASLDGIPGVLTALGGATYDYGANKARTNSNKAALGSAVGYLAGLGGGIKGAQVGESLAGEGASGLTSFAAGTAGAAVGQAPGDYVGMVTQPGETTDLSKFREDPLNVPAYFAGQPITGAALHLAQKSATLGQEAAGQTIADTPDLDSLTQKDDADRYAELNAKPVQNLTELELQEKGDLARTLGQRDEALVADNPPDKPSVDSTQEAPATLKSQLYLLNMQKKAVVEVPQDQDVPDMPEVLQGFKSHQSQVNGNSYFYDERKTTPDQIDNAVKTNSLGYLLGYGVPNVPDNPNGEIGVLRSKSGVEKAAVVMSQDTKSNVLSSLGQMALGDDSVSVESPEQVLNWRQNNQGLQKLYSIAQNADAPSSPQDEISFTNHVLDMFGNSLQSQIKGYRQKGPRFQLDQDGNINGTGLLKAVKQWAPSELWDHYQQAGIETLLGANKVSAVDFTKWLRENTPEVEVKKLQPSNTGVDKSVFQHQLETLGYQINEEPDGRPLLYRDDKLVDTNKIPVEDSRLWNNYQAGEDITSDAATGRYGVEPKDLKDMPGAVDILTRVPSDRFGQPSDSKILYKGPHFGDSDRNVLASIRGYMETLPSGEKAFHVFEVQSDWGQRVAKGREDGLYDENGRQVTRTGIPDHPLLSSYETLALKTAIQHARSEGATKLAVSDAETAMMTEGHDRNTVRAVSDSHGKPYPDLPVKIPQESGMRAAYDQRLPAIMKKLTNDSGRNVTFGEHKQGQDLAEDTNPAGSPIFKDSKGNPKRNVTARLYDLSHLNPQVSRLFSLYDADAQTSFESSVRDERAKIDSGERPSEELSREQVLQRAVDGNLSKLDPLLNFLNAVRGQKGVIRAESFENPNIMAMVDLNDRTITINKAAQLRVNEAFAKLAHEQTHIAVDELPDVVQQALKQNIMDLGPGRQAILEQLKQQFNMGDKFDPEYLSGGLFDPKDPHFADKVMHEFTGGLMEVAAEAHFQQSNSDWMNWLPTPVIKLVNKVMQNLKSYFGDTMPSVSAMLNKGEAGRLGKIVDAMQKSAVDADQINLRSLLQLHKTDTFDEDSFLNTLSDSKATYAPKIKGGNGDLASFAGDLYDEAKESVKTKMENNFLTALWRGRIKPYTMGHFLALHALRPNIKSDEFGYLAMLGQKDGGGLSREQAIERWGKFFDEVTDPNNPGRNKFLTAFGKINEENQNRIEASQQPLTDADLVSRKDMVEKYGMTDEQAGYTQKLIKMVGLVGDETARKNQQVDNTNLTRLFYGANKAQDIEGVRSKINRLSRVMQDAGGKRFELESTMHQLDLVKSMQEPDLEQEAVLNQQIQQLSAEDANFSKLLQKSIQQEFAGAIPMQPENDPFVQLAAESMTKLAALRNQQQIMTRNAGYSPMTRRGRFRLRVYDPSDLGEEFAKVKEYKGFQTEAEMNEYIKDNNIPEADYEKMDMNDIKQRVQSFTPDRLQTVRDMAKAQLDSAIAKIQQKNSGLKPELADVATKVLTDIQSSFQPLSQEIKDVISVKGDKFGERRYNVAGMNTNDFLPNAFEYMQYKTAAGNKAIAKAESDLQISRAELDSQPELRERMQKEQSYVLNSQTEYNTAKKLIFYYYLGASFRHIIQYGAQVPLNGISQMTAEGSGLSSYKHFLNAAKLVTKYNYKGTTGDRTIDVLLKQAAKDGISLSTTLEAPIAEGSQLQNILDGINANGDGNAGFGEKLSYQGTKIVRGMEQFLQSTSVASEEVNRKTTFVASLLAQRAKGVTDPKALYDKASEFTNFVNFVGDKPNRPGYMILHGGTPIHGALGLVTTLQSYVTNHIGQLYSFYEKGFNQGSKADKQALYVGLAHLLAFSGAMGMVGASTAEQIIQDISDGKSLKTLFRQGMVQMMSSHPHVADRISDAVLGGFPALLGIDSSNSIGLGSPFFRYQAGEPIDAEQFGGAGVGILGRVATGIHQVQEDPFNPQAWWNATRSASPTFLSNAIRTYDLLNSGSTVNTKGQPVGDPLGVAGSVSSLLGFTPMEATKQRDFNDRVYQTTKKSADDYQRAVLNVSHLLDEYQRTGNVDSLTHANDIFSTYLNKVSGLQDRDDMVSSITDQLEQDKGHVTKMASLKDSATRQSLEMAFPSVKSHYPSEVSTALDETTVAQLLGQDDVMARKLQSLPEGLRQKALTDALRASGLRPEQVQQFLQPESVVRLGH